MVSTTRRNVHTNKTEACVSNLYTPEPISRLSCNSHLWFVWLLDKRTKKRKKGVFVQGLESITADASSFASGQKPGGKNRSSSPEKQNTYFEVDRIEKRRWTDGHKDHGVVCHRIPPLVRRCRIVLPDDEAPTKQNSNVFVKAEGICHTTRESRV